MNYSNPPKKKENRHVNYQYLIYHDFRRIFLSHFSIGFALLRLFPPHFQGWSWNHLKTMDLAQRNTALAALSVENLKVGPWTLFRAIEIRNLHLGNKKGGRTRLDAEKRPTSLYAYIYIIRYMWLDVYMCNIFVCVVMYVYAHVHAHANVHVYVYVLVCVCIYIYIYIYIYILISLYI